MIGALVVSLIAGANTGSVLAELEKIDRSLAKLEQELRSTAGVRELAHVEIARVESDLAETKVRYRETLTTFQRRLRALARMPQGARMIFLGQAESFRSYLRVSRLLRLLANHDRKIAADYREQSYRLERLEDELARREAELAEMEAELRLERNAVAETRSVRVELLRRIASNRETGRRAAKERRRAREALGSLVGKMKPRGRLSSNFSRNAGKLPWPTQGLLAGRFGEERDEAYGTRTRIDGWELRAPAGTKVQAISGGVVVYADWLRAYGQLVIVDHGDGFHSLYAHLAKIAVPVGQEVDTGDRLGSVGDTGSLQGTLLYFEIRRDGTPQDPAQWLRR